MRIIAFGSSHTTGYKLSDVEHAKEDQLSRFAYPAIVADLLGVELVNYGRTGNSIDQIYTDVLGYMAESQEGDFLIVHLPVNPTWFKLITSDNVSVNIVKPESLNFKGKDFSKALESFYGFLTGDSHWNRLWYIYFYSLMNLLHYKNKKFIWFFDSYSTLWEQPNDMINQMPESVQREIRRIKDSSYNPTPEYLGIFFADHLCWHLPKSLKPCGHHDESGHQFWASEVLVPKIKERLTTQ